jgi:predicted nuclease with TOPRIM domain
VQQLRDSLDQSVTAARTEARRVQEAIDPKLEELAKDASQLEAKFRQLEGQLTATTDKADATEDLVGKIKSAVQKRFEDINARLEELSQVVDEKLAQTPKAPPSLVTAVPEVVQKRLTSIEKAVLGL